MVASPNESLEVIEIIADQQYDLKFAIRNKKGVDLYLDYTKGSEDGINFKFRIKELEKESEGYLSEISGGKLIDTSFDREISGSPIIPIVFPESGDELYIEVTFTGSTSSVGTVNVEARYAEKHQ